MIGDMDERTCVHKLWFGLRQEIQQDLWCKKLNPEISSLEDVIAAAEVIEIAQSVPAETSARGHNRTSNTVWSAAAMPAGDERQRRRKKPSRRDRRQDDRPRNDRPGPSNGQTPRGKKRDSPKSHSKPKLSKEEQERHKADGLCFHCHRAGHFSRNCPDLNKVPSGSKGSDPPGVPTFGVSIDYDAIEDQRAQSQASKADLLLGSVSLIVDDDGLEPDVDLPGLWDESASEASDGSDDDDALFDLSEGPRYTRVPVYSKGVWVQDLIFPDNDEYNSDDDTTSSSSASEPSTDEDDSFEYYETAPESQPYASDDDDSDDSPPCAGACAITVDYSDDDSDPSDLEGSGATIMDLNDGPHLDCCISHPGELGEPLGDRAAD